MGRKRTFYSVLLRLAGYGLCLVVAFSLSEQWIKGRNGLQEAEKLRASIVFLNEAAALEKKAIKRIENTIQLLDPAGLDPDLVGEILRQELYWLAPDEYLVILNAE